MWDLQVLEPWEYEGSPILLQILVNYWGPNTETFILDGMPLRHEVEDIYFITELSHRGEVLKLTAHGVGRGMSIDEYIVVYFLLDNEKMGSQVPINEIQILNIKVIILVLV